MLSLLTASPVFMFLQWLLPKLKKMHILNKHVPSIFIYSQWSTHKLLYCWPTTLVAVGSTVLSQESSLRSFRTLDIPSFLREVAIRRWNTVVIKYSTYQTSILPAGSGSEMMYASELRAWSLLTKNIPPCPPTWPHQQQLRAVGWIDGFMSFLSETK